MKGFTRLRIENALLLVLTLLVAVVGYAFFRSGYFATDRLPFARNVTVLITALLLNKQTLVELQKEWNLRYFELKARTFLDFFDRVAVRRDLIGELDRHGPYSPKVIEEIVLQNEALATVLDLQNAR